MRIAGLALAATLSLPLVVLAAGQDELWEVTSQMNAPGIPPGMGAMTQRVCQDKDPSKQAAPMPEKENCKVTDRKQSGSRVTLTVTCTEGKAIIEHTYNAARTEYTGTTRMTTREGDMVMNTIGRKIGTCDATADRRQREAQVAAVQGQAAQAQAQVKQQYDLQIAECAEAVRTMQYAKLGVHGQCKQQPDYCKAMASMPEAKPVVAACSARQVEYCRRYRTEEGFLQAKADPQGAEGCGLSVEQVKADLCPAAVQKESLAFLGRYCIAEAKPLAEKHCGGLDFTALRAGKGARGKYDDFCLAYLSNASLAAAPRRDAPPAAAQPPAPADPVSEGISQGINKLRGLFGR